MVARRKSAMRSKRSSTRKPATRSRKAVTYKRSNRAYTKVSRPMAVAERLFTTLKYVEYTTLSITNPTLQKQVFQTSIFDPNFTGTGHQPLWHDQLQTLYNRYRCYGIRYDAVAVNTNTYQLMTIAVVHSNSSTSDTVIETAVERNRTKTYTSSIQGHSMRMKGYLSIPQVWGISKKEMIADDSFFANFGATPAKCGYLHFLADTKNATAICNLMVKLTYYVECFDRILISQS